MVEYTDLVRLKNIHKFEWQKSSLTTRKQTCGLAYTSIFFFFLNILLVPFLVKSYFLADPGEARGCSTNTSVIHKLSD